MITNLIEHALEIDDISVIKINVLIEPVLNEDLDEVPISKYLTLEDIIDDTSFDYWCNFESAILEYIKQNYILDNVSMSKNAQSLSEYIDFYTLDDNGDAKSTIIDLRLSNHRVHNNNIRVKKLNKRYNNLNQKYRLIGITVNGETFDSYKEAFKCAKKMIDDTASSV